MTRRFTCTTPHLCLLKTRINCGKDNWVLDTGFRRYGCEAGGLRLRLNPPLHYLAFFEREGIGEKDNKKDPFCLYNECAAGIVANLTITIIKLQSYKVDFETKENT